MIGRTAIILTAAALVLSCNGPAEIITPVLPYDPVDEGWKAVKNLEYAFNMKDLSLLDETVDQTFEYPLAEADWDDYDGDGIVDTSLNEEYFLQTVSMMFNSYEVVELDLNGTGEDPWPGDTTGVTMQYERSYCMSAYNWVGGQQEGWTRTGQAYFLCRPDTSDVWRVTGILNID